MSFLSTYKRLDNLLKTFNEYPNGVTSYINEMDNCIALRFQCNSWADDYHKLKRYRHIRNAIAHDNNFDDDDCALDDEQWLQTFYNKVMKAVDPVALYYKKQQIVADNRHTTHTNHIQRTTTDTQQKSAKTENQQPKKNFFQKIWEAIKSIFK